MKTGRALSFLARNKHSGRGAEDVIDFALMYLYCIVTLHITSIVTLNTANVIILNTVIWKTSNKENFLQFINLDIIWNLYPEHTFSANTSK